MQNKKILLVDDEHIILLSLSKELRENNFDVTVASSGEEALTILKDGHYDVIITDMIMEGMNGTEVLKESKKINPDICVIILTGHGDMDSVIDALRLGVDDYLSKPCEIDELLFRINNCLAKKELQNKVRIYEEILPVCMYCKSIRDDTDTEAGKGEWIRMEKYLVNKNRVEVSHGCCPSCYDKHKKDWEL